MAEIRVRRRLWLMARLPRRLTCVFEDEEPCTHAIRRMGETAMIDVASFIRIATGCPSAIGYEFLLGFGM
jgi:hypothetical protein